MFQSIIALGALLASATASVIPRQYSGGPYNGQGKPEWYFERCLSLNISCFLFRHLLCVRLQSQLLL